MATPPTLHHPSIEHRPAPAGPDRAAADAPDMPRTSHVPEAAGGARLVAGSPAMRRVLALVQRVAPTRAEVLVTGEPGTGKERLARLVHERSPRAAGPLVVVHCGALDGAMLEVELFGVAQADAAPFRGRVAEADGGTLVLHEVGTLPPALQRRLIHTMQTRQLPRPGGRPDVVDVRVVATSSTDLAAGVAAGQFAADLHFRLGVCPIAMPPLRARPEDVAPLAEHFLAEAAVQHGLRPAAFSPDALRRMAEHPWPGNVRELRSYAVRMAILHEGETALPFDLPRPTGSSERDLLDRAADAGWDLARLEREYILAVLDATRGHQSRAAQRLGIDRRTLYRKLREYGVKG